MSVPAAAAAKAVGLSAKTVSKWCKRLRERIAADREAELEKLVYSDGWKVDNRLSLNGFHHKRINHDNPWSMAKCISTAQRAREAMLNAYNGGFIRNDRLFVRERPLRFSHRDDEKTLDYLQDTLLNWFDQVTCCLRENVAAIGAIGGKSR